LRAGVRDQVIARHTDENGDIIDPETGEVIPPDEVTIDHVTPVVEHWNEQGYNQARSERNDWYNDPSNLRPRRAGPNFSDGAKLGASGETFRQDPGPNYGN
jgi:hypothetical protein